MKNYDYYGIFLDPKDRKMLEKRANIPEGWTIYCEHCTLIHHTCPDQTIVPFLDMFIGKTVPFVVVAIGRSEHAIAYKVNLPSMNKVSHITAAIAPGHKPVESNDITEWDYAGLPNKELWGWLGVHFSK